MILFADNTSASVKKVQQGNRELIESVSDVTDVMETWYTSNGFKLNIDKTKILKFSMGKTDEVINIPSGVFRTDTPVQFLLTNF